MSDRGEIQQDTIDRLMIGRATEGDQLIAACALAALKAREAADLLARDFPDDAAGVLALQAAVALQISDENHRTLATFAMRVWCDVRRQGATELEALATVYHAGMTHIREAMGMPYKQAQDVFGESKQHG